MNIFGISPYKKAPIFYRWLLIIGLFLTIGSAVLSIRLIWEKTVWTWERGPQMVGFSLAHGSGGLLLLFPILLVGWLLVIILSTVWNLIKKRNIALFPWTIIIISILVLISLKISYGFWQRLFVNRLVAGPYAAQFLTYAAGSGDLKTVQALMSKGVPAEISTREGTTALHAAAVEGKIRVIEYLLSRGADINAIDRYGDSPLEKAISMKRDGTVKYMIEHGAKRIVGDETVRQKVIEEIVKEDIKKMDIRDKANGR